jgi:rare lipoprotein A
MKRYAIAVLLFVAYGCATTAPTPPQIPPAEQLHGVASWYGEEFAGRTTANGEIFDPMLLTAAHRTLPFGTILDVRNTKTNQTVRVRVNDRGPYINERLIDLSYAAAQQIGLADAGVGEVDITVVQTGRGDREPPAPYSVTVPDAPAVTIPGLPAPAPAAAPAPAPVTDVPAVPATVETIQVIEQHASGVETRRQVAANGRTIEDVPVNAAPGATATPAPLTPAPPSPAPSPRAQRLEPARPAAGGRYVVQVGAFGQEANARTLQQKLHAIGQDSYVEHDTIYRVRIGPFATHDQAVAARAKLEAAGISAIIIAL